MSSNEGSALLLSEMPARRSTSPFVLVQDGDGGAGSVCEVGSKRELYMYVNVFSVTEVVTSSETFNAYFHLGATWVEPELSRAEDFRKESAWTPRFQYMNAVETPELFDEMLEVLKWRHGPGGEPVLRWSAKCRGTFRSLFRLGSFPFDAQELRLSISPEHKHTLLFEDRYDGVQSKLRTEYTMLPEFTVDQPELKPREKLALGKFATLDITLVAHRRFTFHLWNVFFPVFLLTSMQFSVFAVDVASVADRLGVTLTLVLASVAYKYVVSQNLPNISYLTLCDLYVLSSFVFMAAVVLQNAMGGISAQADEDVARARDLVSLRVFQAVFVVGHVLYLAAVLVALQRRRARRKTA